MAIGWYPENRTHGEDFPSNVQMSQRLLKSTGQMLESSFHYSRNQYLFDRAQDTYQRWALISPTVKEVMDLKF